MWEKWEKFEIYVIKVREVWEKGINLRKRYIKKEKVSKVWKSEKSAKSEICEKKFENCENCRKSKMCEKGKEVWELQEKVKYMTKSGWPLQTVKKWDVWEIVREVSDKVRSVRIIEMSGKIWEKHE